MKGQFSLEAVMTIVILLIIFSILLLDAIYKQNDADNLKLFLERKNACGKLSDEVQSIFVLGNGAETTITINKGLNVTNKLIYVEGVVCSLCCNVTKNSQSNFNVVGTIKIKNIGGEIVVS